MKKSNELGNHIAEVEEEESGYTFDSKTKSVLKRSDIMIQEHIVSANCLNHFAVQNQF